jgi:hypothetical protein
MATKKQLKGLQKEVELIANVACFNYDIVQFLTLKDVIVPIVEIFSDRSHLS